MTSYVVTHAAQADIERIIEWIAKQNPRAADRFEAVAYGSFARLARHPHLGHFRADLTDRPVLFWTVMKSFVVIYRKATPLEILRVAHWRQDISAFIFDDE